MAAAGNGRQGASLPAIGEAPTQAAPGGFPCARCGGRTTVMDSRSSAPLGWRRRRMCLECRHRFTTIEIVYTNELTSAMEFKRRVLPKLNELVRWITALDADAEGDDDD